MTPIEKAKAKLLELANAELGYMEKATNAYLDDKTANAGSGNYTKYGAYFDAQRGEYEYYNGKKNGFDWCDQFVDWLFANCFGLDNGRRMLYQPMRSCGAGCAWSASYFRENGAWSTTPGVCYQIFFGKRGDESHTGIVVDKTSTTVTTIEGNANNRVQRRTYAITDSNIAGYGIPDFGLVAYMFVDDDTPVADDDDIVFTKEQQIAIQRMIDDTIVRRFGKEIKKISDIPHVSVQKVVRKLLDLEAIDGGTAYDKDPDDINLGAYDFVRVLVMAARYADLVEAENG